MEKNRFPALPLFDVSVGSASFCPLEMTGHIMKGPWLCRNSWEIFWSEKLLAVWNKVVFAVVSQSVYYLLPGRQLRSWGCSQGHGQGDSLHFLSVSEWGSERDSDSRGQCGQGASRLPAPLSCTLVVGRVIPFGDVHWNWRSLCRQELLGRDWQHLLKSIFTVLGALLLLPTEVCFPSIAENQLTLPQPVTNASICKMTVRNA